MLRGHQEFAGYVDMVTGALGKYTSDILDMIEERNTVHRSRRKSGRTVADVVPDVHYPGMYRVKLAGEPLSDMVNLTRARDAAVALAGQTLRDPSVAPIGTGLEDKLLQFHRPGKAFDGLDARPLRLRI
jgi:hypothetical protein